MASKPVTVPKGFLSSDAIDTTGATVQVVSGFPLKQFVSLLPKAKPAKPAKIKDVAKPDLETLETTAAGTVTVTLPPVLGEKILQPIKGQGGWQTIMGSIQSRTHTVEQSDSLGAVTIGYQLKVTPNLLKVMVPYAVSYGGGGYQGTIRHILALFVSQQLTGILALVKGEL